MFGSPSGILKEDSFPFAGSTRPWVGVAAGWVTHPPSPNKIPGSDRNRQRYTDRRSSSDRGGDVELVDSQHGTDHPAREQGLSKGTRPPIPLRQSRGPSFSPEV